MSVITKDLGIASAYGYAKSKGYTGTEEEFAELMASYANVAQQAEAAAQDAEDAKDAAITAKTAAQTAQTAAESAQTAAAGSAQTASTKATEASNSAQSAAGSATAAGNSATAAAGSATTAQAAAQTATTKASEASSSASAASTAKTGAETARTGAQTAQAAAETAQENAEAAAASVSASAAQIEQNTADIGQIKNDFNQLDSEINVNGKRYFNESDFARGNIAYASGVVLAGTYRVITPDIQSNSEDITIKSVADGFLCYVGYYSDAAGSSVSDGFASRVAGYIIPKNTYYRMLIRRVTEDTSEVADVSEFVHKVEIYSYIEETYLKKTDAASTYAREKKVSDLYDILGIDFAELTWEQGSISTSDGTDTSSPFWIRTSNYFSYSSGNTLHVECDSAHRGNAYEYALENGTYVFKGFKAFSSSEPFIKNISDSTYYRFAMTRTNNTQTPISDSEYALIYTAKGIFQYNNNVINPEYEILDVPAALLSSGWSDFCIIDGKLWLFKASADEDHTDTSGKIKVYDMTDWSLVKEISHNFGHMNTCSYDATHDILLVGNLPGNTTYPCALYIFYNVSSWLDETSLSFSTVDKSIINLRSGGWTTLSNVSATFGENNGAFRNIVYVSLAYGKHLAKLILGMGTNQLTYGYYTATDADKFNGTFKVLKESDSDYELGNNTEWDSQVVDEVWQGCDYYKGKILSCNGDMRLATANLWNFRYDNTINREIIGFDIYQDNGEPYRDDTITQSLFPEGIAYDPTSDYIYMGIIYTQSGNRAMHLIRYKI